MSTATLPAFSSRFQLLRRLGAGGMGVVYEALDTERNTKVALKTLRELEPSALLRFKTEFRSLQDLVHPNLIALDELFEERGQWFFTMELVNGVDFLTYSRKGKHVLPANGERLVDPNEETAVDWGHVSSSPSTSKLLAAPQRALESDDVTVFDEPRLRAALSQLVGGLLHLHGTRMIHRDIKPSNVLVSREGRLVILDFGLVVEQRGSAETEGHIVGTAAYMAPEQAASKPIGPEADWYSVGVVLYEALTGQLPFDGAPIAVLMEKQMREPPPPRSIAPNVPADLDELCVELLRFDPARRPTGAELARRLGLESFSGVSALVPSSLSAGAPFVGRGKELLALERASEVVRTGKAITVYVHGESGVGKSALVERFVGAMGEPEGQPVIVLRGRCYERESVPYKALDGVIDALSRALGRMRPREVEPLLPERAALLAQVFPVLRRVEAFAQAPRDSFEALDPQELRDRVFGSIRELLSNLTALVHVCVVIDDFQWADADSMALLREVLRVPAAPPLLLLLTLRAAPDGGNPISQLNPGSNVLPGEVRMLPVGRLSMAESYELAERLVQRAPPTLAHNAETLARESQGHPLFIEELVRHAAIMGPTAGAVSRLEDALWARIERLPAPARSLLELLAIAGHPVGREELERASNIEDPLEMERCVSALRAGRFVRSTSAAHKKAIEPFHDRIRAAVASHMTAEQKQTAHAHLALALEASPRPDAEALAEHWRGAGENEKAADYAEQAAEAAHHAFAFDRAARLFRLALVLRTPPEEELRALRRKLGDALVNAGRGPEAAEMYLEASLGAATGEALELRRRAATQLLLSGHVEEGLATFRNVLHEIGVPFPETPAAALRSRFVRRAWLKMRGLSYRPRDASVVPDAERVRIDVCFSLALGLGTVDPTRGADFQSQGLARALAAGDVYRVARALAIEATYVAANGAKREREVDALLARAESDAQRSAHPHAVAISALARGFSLYLWGRYAEGLPFTERAAAMFRERCVGAQNELDIAVLLSLRAMFFLGDFGALKGRMPVHLRQAIERGNLNALHGLRTGHLTGVWLAQDDAKGAALELDEASKIDESENHWVNLHRLQEWLGRSALALYKRDPEASYLQGVLFEQALRRSPLRGIEQERIDLAWMLGRLAIAASGRAETETRLAHAEALATTLSKERAPHAQPASLVLRAAVAARRGDAVAASSALDRALPLWQAAKMAGYAAMTQRALGIVANDAKGAAAVVDAESELRHLGVARADKFANTYVPGFEKR